MAVIVRKMGMNSYDNNSHNQWIYYPACGNKTCNRLRTDTILMNFSLCYPTTSNKVNMIVDMELKGRIQTELMKAILKFELKVK